MPPDVFLMLASSGLTLVASLLFFVSDDAPPAPPRVTNDVTFCLPPTRPRPPPLPSVEPVRVETLQGVLSLRPDGNDWLISFEAPRLSDSPAVSVSPAGGHVHDLRWNGRAGIPKVGRRAWKQKTGQA